jgi:hypothetical protein
MQAEPTLVETEVTGELDAAGRTQVPAWSTPLIQRSWNVACAAAPAARARAARNEVARMAAKRIFWENSQLRYAHALL